MREQLRELRGLREQLRGQLRWQTMMMFPSNACNVCNACNACNGGAPLRYVRYVRYNVTEIQNVEFKM